MISERNIGYVSTLRIIGSFVFREKMILSPFAVMDVCSRNVFICGSDAFSSRAWNVASTSLFSMGVPSDHFWSLIRVHVTFSRVLRSQRARSELAISASGLYRINPLKTKRKSALSYGFDPYERGLSISGALPIIPTLTLPPGTPM